jgi:arginine-tRNA-protein transferase
LYFFEDVIDETQSMRALSPADFDLMMAQGWRSMGDCFMRHSFSLHNRLLCRAIPLRIRISAFKPSKRHSKIIRQNAALKAHFSAIRITKHHQSVFKNHTVRFTQNPPSRLGLFLSDQPHKIPVKGLQLTLSEGEALPFAYSFCHIGTEALSATYCCFEPDALYSRYSPGIYTMLLEIEKARELGCQFYYHGYVYDVPSSFDYKLNFEGLEAYDWKEDTWRAL